MKKLARIWALTLLTLSSLVCLPTAAYAAQPEVNFKNGRLIQFSPGSEFTDSDLFSGFKNVMPGDVLTEDISVVNDCDDCDHIKVYLRAVPHDGVSRDLSQGVVDSGETVATMRDFLSQLTLSVYNGAQRIYHASPDQPGELAEGVYLGAVRRGESLGLHLRLEVPVELGNEYMDRAGEVDWVFLTEKFEEPEPTETPAPTTAPVYPTSKPYYKPTLIQTGQPWLPAVLLGGAGALLTLLGLCARRKNGRK